MANIKIQILQLLHLSVYTEIKDKGLSVTHCCGVASQHPSGLCNSTEMWPGVLHEASTLEKLGLSKSVGRKGQCHRPKDILDGQGSPLWVSSAVQSRALTHAGFSLLIKKGG